MEQRTPFEPKLTYEPFDFLKLDNKLNTKKIQQKKKQAHQKNVLSVYEKKLPNLQLLKHCNNIMAQYKNHYNINRRFTVFSNQTKFDQQKSQIKGLKNYSELNPNQQRLPLLRIQRSQSTVGFNTHQPKQTPKNANKKKSTSLVDAQKIMKPIKTNQYVNEKGFVKFASKSNFDPMKNLSNEKSQSVFTTSTQFRNKLYKNILSLTKDHNSESPDQLKLTLKQRKPSKLALTRERKRQIKKTFRKTILLIIEKMKAMKLTFGEIIQKDPFDKKTPYKFGQAIFIAVKQGYEPKVFRIILQNRLSIFSIDTTGKTPLMWACIRGHEEIVQLLLSNGVETHLRDINGKTALYFAVKYNNAKCAKEMFIHSCFIEDGIESMEMSEDVRKMVRIGLSTHKFLNTIKNVQKKRDYFEQEYRYYFKD